MTERAYRVALRAKRGILVREGAELSSDEVGELAAGTVVSGSIHPTRSSDGRLRVRLLSPLVGFASLSLLDEVRDEQRQRPQSAETLPKLDARTGMLMGMLPALLAAHRQFTTGGSCFYVGVVTDASGQKYEIYCSPGGVDCLGEEKKQPTRAVSTAAARLMAELPFYDFGFVAWPPSALRESVRPLVPRVPSQASEPPVYFVHPFASIVNELDADEPCHDEIPRDELGTSAARVAARYGELWGANWIIPPYFALRDAGHNVHLASRVVPGHINVVHSYSSGYVGDPARLARVCSAAVVTVADNRSAPGLLEAGLHCIMQNELQACSDDSPPVPRSDGSTLKPREPGRAHTLPMFPQQRLRRRRASRANMVRRVIFVGDRHQLDPALTAPEFTAALRAMEVAFDVIDKSRVPEWGDYRDADLVLALRPPGTAVRLKPPSKLINAWLAGVPALVGPEPAYQRLRSDESDFVEVHGAAEALAAIARLQREPEQYERMLRRCDERAPEFCAEKIAARWARVLFGEVATAASEATEV